MTIFSKTIQGTARLVLSGGAPLATFDPTTAAAPPKARVVATRYVGGGEGAVFAIEIEVIEIDAGAGDHIAFYLTSAALRGGAPEGRSRYFQAAVPNALGSYEIAFDAAIAAQGEELICNVHTVQADGRMSRPRRVVLEDGTRPVILPAEAVVIVTPPGVAMVGIGPVTAGYQVDHVPGETTGADTAQTISRFVTRADAADPAPVENAFPYTIPQALGGAEWRLVERYYDTAGAETVYASAWSPIAAYTDTQTGRPAALAAADWEVAYAYDPTPEHSEAWVRHFRILNAAHPAWNATYLIWTSQETMEGLAFGGGGLHAAMRHPDYATAGAEHERTWVIRANAGAVWKSWMDQTADAGTAKIDTSILAYSADPETTAIEAAVFSPGSDKKSFTTPALPTAAPTPEPTPATGDIYATDIARAMPIQSEAEYLADHPRGDGLQQQTGFMQCLGKPHIVGRIQDVGGASISIDKAVSWGLPQSIGNRCLISNGGAMDPVDPKRFFLVANVSYPLLHDGFGGLYRTVDGGQNQNRVIPFRATGSNHMHSDSIAHHPNTVGPARAENWACILAGRGEDVMECHASTNGGDAWSLVRTLAKGTYGICAHMAGDPKGTAKYYAATETGLWRFENWGSATGGITKLSGSGGLPVGAINGPIHVSADGNTIIVGVRNKGFYKSTNGGGTWSLLYAATNLHKGFVNPWNPRYLAYTIHEPNTNPRFSDDGGATFYQPTGIEKRPGYSGSISPTYQHCHVVWFGDGPELYMEGRQTNVPSSNSCWRSADNGRNLVLSMDGILGVQFGTPMAVQSFDPVDPMRFAMGFLDVRFGLTKTGGRHTELLVIPTALRVAGQHSTCHGLALHPTIDRIAGGIDRTSSGTLYVWDRGVWSKPLGDATSRWHGICYSTDDPNFWYGGRHRSVNGALAWSAMAGLPSDCIVVGCTLTAPGVQAIYAINTAGDRRQLRRSLDHGETWPVVITSPSNLIGVPGYLMAVFKAHPSDKNIVFTKAANPAHIRKWNISAGTFVDLDPTGGADVDFELSRFAIDRNDPAILYASCQDHGTTHKLMRSLNGGASWENLSRYVWRGQHQMMEAAPDGTLLFSTSYGIRAIKGPNDAAGSIFRGLSQKNNSYVGDYMGSGTAPADGGTPPPAPATDWPALAQAHADTAIAAALAQYDDANGTNCQIRGQTPVVLAYAAFTGNTSADARLNAQLDHILRPDRMISANGGINQQFYARVAAMCAIVRRTPRIWDSFSAAKKSKIDAMMKGNAIDAAFVAADKNPNTNAGSLHLRGNYYNTRSTGPNVSSGLPARLMISAAYFGVPELAAMLENYSHSAFRTELNDLFGTTSNMARTFAGNFANAPSAAAIQTALDGWTYYQSSVTSIKGLMLPGAQQSMWKLLDRKVVSGLNNGAGAKLDPSRGKIVSGAANTPHLGDLECHFRELDGLDAGSGGGGERSSMSYAMWTLRTWTDAFLCAEIAGILPMGDADVADALRRFKKAMDVFIYFNQRGYYSWAHDGANGGGGGGPATWDASTTGSWNVPMSLAIWTDILKPRLAL